MTAPRINLVFIAIVVLLVACAGQTPTPTTPPQLSTPPVAPPTNPPVAVIPTLTPPPMFPVGLTSEPLAVVTTAPADKAEDIAVSPELTKIIVQFNHPVVPLVSVDAQKSLPQPLTFSPPVSGSGEWINTSTYSFTPSQSLAVATQYTVNVAALKDMLGQSLAGYSWSFKTASPTILKKYPEELTKFAGVTQPITFTFNTVMDRASTEARFSVTNTDKKTPVAGQLEWQGATARFVPAQPLDYDTHYQVTLKAGAQDANKVAATAKDISWSFTTTPAPGILSTSPADGDKASKDIRNGFTIHFKSPMARNAVTVSVVPTITNQSQYWEYDSNDTTLRVQGGWLASRSYTVTISGQSETRYGEKLGKDTVVRFTAAPLDPMVSLQTTGMMGLYDVNGPELIFANYVNVNRIDFQLSKVKTGDFLSLAGRQRYQIWEKYRPEESALLNKWSVTTQAPVNAMRLISTTLTSNGRTKLQPGVYYLEATSPEISLAQPARHLVVVTALNLALKRTQTEALVWVTDLKTGKPVVNQPLTIYGPNGDTLASGRSDSDGVFRAQFARQEAWDSIYVLSEQDGVIVAAAGSDWNEGINIWDFNMPGQPEAQEFFSNLYTDRAIYRPGQTVYFKGVLRRDKDASYSLPTDIETVPISVHDDQGKEVFSQNVPLSPFGTFNGQFALSPAASIGYYNISFELGQDPHKYFSSVGFQVAQYRAPEFQVEVKTDKPAYINGDTIKVDATSTYFFGGPVANAKVSWRLLSDDLFFNTDKVKGYWSFTDYDLTADRKPTGGVIREGKGTTDAQGNFHFQVPADLKDFPLSQNMTLDVEITDINNQAVSNRVTVPVHKGNFYIGMRPEEYVGSVGKEATVDLITVTPQGDPSPNQTVTVSFYEHKWYSVREKREDGNFYWRSAYTDTLISKVDVKTDAKGEATAKFTPPTGGVFKIAGEATDSAGNKIKRIMGIVNGTTNYILSKMTDEWCSFDEALDEAKALGYAEADSSADLSGRDAAAKITILASIAFNTRMTGQEVFSEGIYDITADDIAYAAEVGYVIKLIALAQEIDGQLDVRVHPMMIPITHPLAPVNGNYNAIFVEGDAVGEVMFFGQGAGRMPTASSVVGDIYDIARDIEHGCTGRLGCTCFRKHRITSIDDVVSSFYLRLTATDRPGVLAKIADAFGRHDVSISSVIQKESAGAAAELIFLTHPTREAGFRAALETISDLDVVSKVENVIRVETQ